MPERRALTVGLTSLLWLAPSFALIVKFVPGVASAPPMLVAALGVLLASAAIGAAWTLLRNVAWLRTPRAVWCVCAVLIIAFAVAYPLLNSGHFGPGSDRDDALNVALQSLLSGHSPYGVTTYLGHRPTPMPGALLLALPSYLLGNAAYQNIIWIPVLAAWLSRRSRDAGPAMFFLLIFVCGCPATLADLLAGGDYAVNVIYVAIAMSMVMAAQASGSPNRRVITMLALAVAISSRPVYLLAAPILAGSIFHEHGRARALTFLAVVCVACAAINLPFYLADPALFPTQTVADKIRDLPANLHLTVMLPILAMCVACASVAFNARGSRLFGWMAASLAVIFVPVLVCYWIVGVPDVSLPWLATDALPVSLFAGLQMALAANETAQKS